jgi:hypothetical protein
VYVLYGVDDAELVTVFVGIADDLRTRVVEQLVVRDTIGAHTDHRLPIDATYLDQLWWWEHPDFSDRDLLRAAELVASNRLQPMLQSRMPISARASDLFSDTDVRNTLDSIIAGGPTGRIPL